LNDHQQDGGFIRRLCCGLASPSGKYASGTLIFAGIVFGILFWGGFNWVVELSNTETFCTSCHEMGPIYEELKQTIHYSNRTGVRATCPDCHVPKEWIHKMIRKAQATNELYHKMMGTIDTPEKFEKERLKLALHEWERMKSVDSRECRNCHDFASMNSEKQSRRSQKRHQQGREQGKTCVDCHTGIAHKNVIKEAQQAEEEQQEADFELDF